MTCIKRMLTSRVYVQNPMTFVRLLSNERLDGPTESNKWCTCRLCQWKLSTILMTSWNLINTSSYSVLLLAPQENVQTCPLFTAVGRRHSNCFCVLLLWCSLFLPSCCYPLRVSPNLCCKITHEDLISLSDSYDVPTLDSDQIEDLILFHLYSL